MIKYLINFFLFYLNFFLFYISKVIPKRHNRWVFGSWYGDDVSDNSKWFYIYMANNHKNIECIYITKNNIQLNEILQFGGKAYRYGSIRSIYYTLTAKVAIMTHCYSDFSPFYLIGGAYKVFFWHAAILIKKLGFDIENKKKVFLKRFKDHIIYKLNEYQLYIAPSDEYKSKLISAFRAKENRIMFSGLPRTNVLLGDNEDPNRSDLCNMIYQIYGFNVKEKTIITYMPTFRDNTSDIFSFTRLKGDESNKLNELLVKHNAVILEKNHFVDKILKNVRRKSGKNNIFNLNELPNIDPQILLCNTDLLITDYSSCYADFVLLNKPVIHFAYDYKYYKDDDRGLYYDIKEFAAGTIVESFNGLLYQIDRYLNDYSLDKDIRDVFIRKYLTYNTRENNENIVKKIYSEI